MIKEVTNSVKAALYQRVSSPLYGTYIFSWCLYNWAIVLPLVLGEGTFDERLNTFKAALYTTTSEKEFIYAVVIVPIVMTALILALQPVLQRFLFIYTEWNKSEGLKKRDKYNSETMLTLEQSNELRASVQKVQQFHQEILKNKDSEIEEYKKQVDIKQITNESLSATNTELITANATTESSSSAALADLATKSTEITELNRKYSRLVRLFKKQRLNKLKLRKHLTPEGMHANNVFLDSLPKLINFNGNFSATENSSITQEILKLSDSDEWTSTCYKILIDGFGVSNSYNMADEYFDNLIKPYLKNFSSELLSLLRKKMTSNNQISERNRAEVDLKLVDAIRSSQN